MKNMLKKIASGLTGLTLAVPMSLGIAFAEDADETTPTAATMTQECITARSAADDTLIAAKTILTTSEIAAIKTHKAAIVAAFALTDMTARAAAFKTAEMAFRSSMKTAMDTFHTSLKASMEAVKTSCGKKPMKEMRMMQGPENAKKGMMHRVMKAFGRGRMKGGSGSSSSSSNAQ